MEQSVPPLEEIAEVSQFNEEYAASNEKFIERIKEVLDICEIEQPLSRINYKRKFHNLICWEEKAHIELLQTKCHGRYHLTVFERNHEPRWITLRNSRSLNETDSSFYGVISGISPDKIAYATQASEAAFVVDKLTTEDVKCEILPANFNHTDNKLYVVFSEENFVKLKRMLKMETKDAYKMQTIDVEFEVKHMFFNSLISAVNLIPNDIISRILPTAKEFLQPAGTTVNDVFINSIINKDDEHNLVLKKLACCQNMSPPVLVSGPFGTGKTRLLATAAHFFIMRGKQSGKRTKTFILMGAHHQASADQLLECFCQLASERNIETDWTSVVRVANSNYRNPNPRYQTFYTTVWQCVALIRRSQTLLVITTFQTSIQLKRQLKQICFTHILLDEGSQAREPETIAPLCVASSSTKIVIAGDSFQVGPSLLVLGEKARHCGMKYSLLERLMHEYKKIGANASTHMLSLNVNHRCHKDILLIPMKLFYGHDMLSKPLKAFCHPKIHGPLVFICSAISKDAELNHNKIEAEILLKETEKLVSVSNWPKVWGPYNLEKVAMISSTRTQVAEMRNCARVQFKSYRNARMLSTYQIQGQEFQALFLSTHEPISDDGNTLNPTKSPCDPYVFNTILTRAKSLIVAAGNPNTLLEIECHMVDKYGKKAKCWSNYLKQCLDNNTFVISDQLKLSDHVRKRFKQTLCKQVERFISDTSSSIAPLAELQPRLLQVNKPKMAAPTDSMRKVISIPNARQISNIVLSPQCAPLTPPNPPRYVRPSATTHGISECSVKHEEVKQKSFPSATTRGISECSVKHEEVKQKSFPTTDNKKPINHPQLQVNPHTSKAKRKRDGKQSHFNLTRDYNSEFPVLTTAKTKLSRKEERSIQRQHYKPLAKVRQINSVDKNFTLNSHSKSYEHYRDKLSVEAIDCDLTRENYKVKFHHLLCWEEREHCKMLEEYNGKFKIVLVQSNTSWKQDLEAIVRYGYITCKDGDGDDAEKLSYTKQASQGSYLIIGNDVIHAMHVTNRDLRKQGLYPQSNSIAIGFTEEQDKLLNKQYSRSYTFQSEVQFELKHNYFERLHMAVDKLSKGTVDRLIPNECDITSEDAPCEDIKVHHPRYEQLEIDKTCQFQALRMILSSNTRFPLLIAGPFGTGKTRLLARAAFELLKNYQNRILICAHHQASVDTFVKYFLTMKENGWEMPFIRVATKDYNSKIKDDYPSVFKTIYGVKNKSFPLVITTLGLAPYIAQSHGNGYFTHILIDEGAQTREPETIAPLCLAGENTKIVIAGDHFQVGPRLLVFGKEAQSFGLGTSIMERLYNTYTKFPEGSRLLHSELITNYRCHHSILMLSSCLFYDSLLLCRSKAPAHPLATFPLVFVCSSLDKNIKQRGGTDEIEAKCLINQVRKYVNNWPSNWEEKDSICVMSPSENQTSLIRKEISDLENVEVLKAYDIQGREYRAIFIGTAEVTDENGDPRNKTKSLCDQFVFNTAITRSQSLVVVVGNPYYLLHGEKNLNVNYDLQHTPRWWSRYLQLCFDSDSFHLNNNLELTPELRHEIKSLKDLVYHQCQQETESALPVLSDHELSEPKSDTILKAYKSALERNPALKHSKLILKRGGNKVLSWVIDDKDPTDKQGIMFNIEAEESYLHKYPCILTMETYGSGKAIPLNPKKKIVLIRGFNNRKGAFNGDTVEVGIFENNPEDKCYGKVLKVIERSSNSTFLCRVIKNNSVLFSPISKTDPLFLNLPFLIKKLLESEDKDSIEDHLQSSNIVVFNPRSVDNCLESEELPKIKQIIPLSSAESMIFLVKYVKWDLSYRIPLGAVIEALPQGIDLYKAERLLKLHLNLNHVDSECSDPPLAKVDRDATVDFYAVTIDPDDAICLDDAVSFKQLPAVSTHKNQEFELGVHIIDVAKHIIEGSTADKLALQRGTSVYPGSTECLRPMHMFPTSVREQLSLLPGTHQNVISCTATVSMQGERITHISESCLKGAVLEPLLKLSYGAAKQIMDDKIENLKQNMEVGMSKFERYNGISLPVAMKHLFSIACHLRQNRLKSVASLIYEVSDPREENCWQTHLLIEELMIWINSIVAKHIQSHYPNQALLRRQRSPNIQQQAESIRKHQQVLGYCQKMSHLWQQCPLPVVPVLLTSHMVKLIRDFIISKNKLGLVNLFTSSRNFPQFNVVDTSMQKSHASAEYCCTREGEDMEEYRHYSLSLLSYTHFSSPLRRYMDVIVQRMLSESLSESSHPLSFSTERHVKLCRYLNKVSRKAKQYEKEISLVSLAVEMSKSSKLYEAFICDVEKGKIELSFPSLELNSLKRKDRSFSMQHLGPLKNVSEVSNFTYELTIQMTSFTEYLGAYILDCAAFQHIQQSSVNTEKTFPIHFDLLSSSEENTLEILKYDAQKLPLTVAMSPDDWNKCMDFAKDSSNANLSEIEKCFLKLPCSDSNHALGIQKPDMCPISYCTLQLDLRPYEVLNVWMTCSTGEAFINPTIQLVEVAPFARVCVQHNTNPARCFSDPHLLYASKPKHQSLKSYVNLWEKLVLAEAAEKSVKERNLSILHGVRLNWPKLSIPSNCVDVKFFSPENEDDIISFDLPESFVDHCSELFKINVGDLVCVRYGVDPGAAVRQVFHMVVCQIESKEGDDHSNSNSPTVYLKIIGRSNCQISEDVKQILKDLCELQVIPLSTSYQRIYSGLVNLLPPGKRRASETPLREKQLICDIALGNVVKNSKSSIKIEDVVKLLKRDEYASNLWDQTQPGKKINPGQEDAIKSSANVLFRLIQGPPGTGKSETGAHLAYIFATLRKSSNVQTSNCVLYCGPSNKAVDVVLEKLHKLRNLQSQRKEKITKILRIYGKTHESRDFPDPGKVTGRYFQESGSDYSPKTWAKEYALHHIIRMKEKRISQKEEEFSKLPKGKVPNGKSLTQYRRLIMKAEQKVIETGGYDIIMCTCSEASSIRVKKYVFPEQVIVDESGMATEPETILPLSICGHVVLIGDHKQLQPVIDYSPAKVNGLSISLFERYAEKFVGFTMTLTIQYRMHEEICRFPSEHFYSEKLETADSVKTRNCKETKLINFWPKGPECPLLFCDVVGKEEDKGTGTRISRRVNPGSKFNSEEAIKALEILHVLHHKHGVDQKQLAVLTPYSAQEDIIKGMADKKGLSNITVTTIIKSQGDEYGFVVLSTVRSQPRNEISNPDHVQADNLWLRESLGFVTDEHQINVGITRSKYGLIIVGNQMLLEYDLKTWKPLIEYYKKRGCILSGESFPQKQTKVKGGKVKGGKVNK